MQKVILIFGPTGVSKSKLSIELAKDIGEIISADSMQIYKFMNIGTAKVSEAERNLVPHHLIDFLEPDQDFSAADFRQNARNIILNIIERGKIPFVVGGTGFYIKALIEGLFEGPPKDQIIRKRLLDLASKNGEAYVYDKLREIDLETAERLHPNDLKRVVRALEVYEITQRTLSDFWKEQKRENCFEFLKIGLTLDRQILYQRINERCESMLNGGLLEEIGFLKAKGYGLDLPSMKAIGYQHGFRYLNGDYDYNEMKRLFMRDTRRFAKRQWTLFNKLKEVHWFQPNDIDEIKELIFGFLAVRVK